MTEGIISSTHPPLPPTTEDDRFSWLRLLRSRRVGTMTFHRLLAEHKTAQNALVALPEVARSAGEKEYEICSETAVDAELKAAKAAKARLLCLGDPEYPPLLASLKDAPPLLWAIGSLDLLRRPAIAIAGARNASSLGLRMARALARELGEAGQIIVSGLARGIDTAAHEAALETGTVAVMGGGVDVLYPRENSKLGEQIAARGLRLSEQPMGLAPRARHFPPRNRIISGLSRALVVVEAAARSGSLITARDALDQGREVMAVPGHPFDPRSSGGNMLLRDGALLVRNGQDVLDGLAPIAPPAPSAMPAEPELPLRPPPEPVRDQRPLRETASLHQQILDRLSPAPTAEDQLIRDLGATAHQVAPALTDLELDGEISRQPGGFLIREPRGN